MDQKTYPALTFNMNRLIGADHIRPVEGLKKQIETRSGDDRWPVSTNDLPIEISPIAKAVNLLKHQEIKTGAVTRLKPCGTPQT
jgi:hypothetical protein